LNRIGCNVFPAGHYLKPSFPLIRPLNGILQSFTERVRNSYCDEPAEDGPFPVQETVGRFPVRNRLPTRRVRE
jgi:hypothetical protein